MLYKLQYVGLSTIVHTIKSSRELHIGESFRLHNIGGYPAYKVLDIDYEGFNDCPELVMTVEIIPDNQIQVEGIYMVKDPLVPYQPTL